MSYQKPVLEATATFKVIERREITSHKGNPFVCIRGIAGKVYIDVLFFGDDKRELSKAFQKDDIVFVRGSLSCSSYESKKEGYGPKIYTKISIFADECELREKRNKISLELENMERIHKPKAVPVYPPDEEVPF